MFDPEIAINRAVDYYRKRGYNDKWIKDRLDSIVDRKQFLRDNMSDIEVLLTNLGETATRELTKEHKPYGLKQNMEVARRGGNIAKITRDNLEKELGRTVITNQNKLNYKYLDETKK